MRIYTVYYKNKTIKEFFSLTQLWQGNPNLSKEFCKKMIKTGIGSKKIKFVKVTNLKNLTYIVCTDKSVKEYKSFSGVCQKIGLPAQEVYRLIQSGEEYRGFTVDIL